jgi:DNA (cytosine-5)-methyltransferase 1
VADRDGESRAQGRPVNSGRNQESNAQPWAGPCGGGVSGDMGNSDTTRLAGRGELWDRSDRIKAGAPGVADGGGMGQPDGNGRLARSPSATPAGHRGAAESAGSGAWSDVEWLTCIDGKQRPTQRGIRPLADGSTGRVGQLRAYGNAIVPQVAAEVIGSYMDMSA